MGWQWHQLDHMQIICTSLQTDNHASTSLLSFYRPNAFPATQPTAWKHWMQMFWNKRRKKINWWLAVTAVCAGCVVGISSCVPVSAVEGRLRGARHGLQVYFTPVSLPASSGESLYNCISHLHHCHHPQVSPCTGVFHTCITPIILRWVFSPLPRLPAVQL